MKMMHKIAENNQKLKERDDILEKLKMKYVTLCREYENRW